MLGLRWLQAVQQALPQAQPAALPQALPQALPRALPQALPQAPAILQAKLVPRAQQCIRLVSSYLWRQPLGCKWIAAESLAMGR